MSRAEWIREWMESNPGRPAPCSAKAMYRVADSELDSFSQRFNSLTDHKGLNLHELKERAAQVRLLSVFIYTAVEISLFF